MKGRLLRAGGGEEIEIKFGPCDWMGITEPPCVCEIVVGGGRQRNVSIHSRNYGQITGLSVPFRFLGWPDRPVKGHELGKRH